MKLDNIFLNSIIVLKNQNKKYLMEVRDNHSRFGSVFIYKNNQTENLYKKTESSSNRLFWFGSVILY